VQTNRHYLHDGTNTAVFKDKIDSFRGNAKPLNEKSIVIKTANQQSVTLKINKICMEFVFIFKERKHFPVLFVIHGTRRGISKSA